MNGSNIVIALSIIWGVATVGFIITSQYFVASGWGVGTGIWLIMWKTVINAEKEKVTVSEGKS